MREPVWLTYEQVQIFHEVLIVQHGGLEGERDTEALKAALARPVNLFLYEKADMAELAATYAHGIAKNHPFHDGNKRAAFASAAVFLKINGFEITMTEEEAAVMTRDLAAGEVTQKQFAEFLRPCTKQLEIEQKSQQRDEDKEPPDRRRGRSR